MYYLIQKDTWGSRSFDIIIENLERYGLEYEVCRLEPMENTLYFETERKDVWCLGSIKLAHIAKKYGFTPGSMFNENHDFEVYSKHYGTHLLNYDSLVMNFEDPLPEDSKWTMFFARPAGDTKAFSGQVFMRHSLDSYVADILGQDLTRLNKETRVVLSPLKTIHQEIRCWVIKGKVITTSQYRIGNRTVYQNTDHELDILEFAQSMVDLYSPAEAFVLDICRTDLGFRIVEVNCINCSGLYDGNFYKILNSLEENFN